MENKDLGSKKLNEQQDVNEGFSGENMWKNEIPPTSKLKTDVEIDLNGNPKIVQRARIDEIPHSYIPENTGVDWNKDANFNRGVSAEADINKTVENKDLNSDITSSRYPNSNPDNHENRGNIKLDGE